ncbi:MAG: TrbI/VirB10 family protein [Sphingomonas sp.]|jgi:type IV secretion system protein VirB10|uniref:TrbI/VirB10 family protein n=1 Tax=Sphingomonas sp. TaxID=28214 RepID=UPI0035686CD5
MSDGQEAVPAVPDLRLRSDPPRVMRLSRKALITLALLASVGIGGSLFYALQPSHRQAAEELYNTDSRSTADSVTSAPKDYGQVPKLGPPLPGDLGRPIVSAQQRGADVPAPPMGPGAGGPQTGQATNPASPAPNAAQAARQRIRQEHDAARTSKLFLGTAAANSVGATAPLSSADLLGATGNDRPGAAAGGAQAVTSAPADDAVQNGQAAKRAFLKAGNDHPATSSGRLEGPASPYVLQAGSVIAAALITGIRSDLPGQITAQVTENVYDSPTGRILLIPQGSKLVGEYDSQISFGQNRVLLAWDRLILPDGRSLALDRVPGADASGFAGLQDGTNYHWGGIAKAALLSTALGIGAQAGSNGNGDLARAIRQGTSDTINQAGQQIVRRQLNVQPTLTIRPGYPLRVVVTRDLVLAPIALGGR